jgi:hypothetical protein
MLNAASHIRRLNPWLRGAVVLYLLSTLCLVAVHQHHGGLAGHDCALCTVAHTPAISAPAAPHQAALATSSTTLPAPGEQRWDSEPRSTSRTRAPPIA